MDLEDITACCKQMDHESLNGLKTKVGDLEMKLAEKEVQVADLNTKLARIEQLLLRNGIR